MGPSPEARLPRGAVHDGSPVSTRPVHGCPGPVHALGYRNPVAGNRHRDGVWFRGSCRCARGRGVWGPLRGRVAPKPLSVGVRLQSRPCPGPTQRLRTFWVTAQAEQGDLPIAVRESPSNLVILMLSATFPRSGPRPPHPSRGRSRRRPHGSIRHPRGHPDARHRPRNVHLDPT